MRALAISSPTKARRHPDAEGAGHRRRARQLARRVRRAGHHRRAARGAGDGGQDRDQSRGWKDALAKNGWDAWFLGGDDYKKFIDEDIKRIGAIIESLGLKK